MNAFFTKALALLGTLLVWFPLLATVFISVAGSLHDRLFRFDYLMPAELFPSAFVGGGLLLWASLKAHSRRGLIAWGLGLAIVSLFGGQALAVLTGLASGAIAPAGWPWVLVIASLVIYTLALLELGLAGLLLLRHLFNR
jgi:hypothetical protein